MHMNQWYNISLEQMHGDNLLRMKPGLDFVCVRERLSSASM